MKKLFRIFKLMVVLFLIAGSNQLVSAQDYNTAVGVRLGGLTTGFTVKHMMQNNSAIEGILGFEHHSLLIIGLYEKNVAIASAPGLYWYYGAGAHIGFYNDGYNYYYYQYHGNHGSYEAESDHGSNVGLGIDGIIGLEYKFSNAPINIGLDIKPFIDVTSDFYLYWDGALSVRYTF